MRNYLDGGLSGFRDKDCSAWSGHAFVLNGDVITCATCAHEIRMPTPDRIELKDSCTNWYGHKIVSTQGVTYCMVCGVKTSLVS